MPRLKYFDPREPGSFAGVKTFTRQHSNHTYNDLAKVLSTYRSYTLHRPFRRRFPRIRIVAGGINQLWETDLSDMNEFAQQNDSVRF